MTKTSIFINQATTGCSCCSDQNYYDGNIHTNLVSAKNYRDRMFMDKVLSSQFYKNGLYYTYEIEVDIVKFETETHYIISKDNYKFLLIQENVFADSFYIEDNDILQFIAQHGKLLSKLPC